VLEGLVDGEVENLMETTMIQPCDKCTEQRDCEIHKAVKRNLDSSPWKIDDILRETFSALVTVSTGEAGQFITLECSDFKRVPKPSRFRVFDDIE
jgi:hypothetical protein